MDSTAADVSLAQPGRASESGLPRLRLTVASVLVFMWVLQLFEPEWFLASFGLGPLRRIPTLIFPFAVAFALYRLNLRTLVPPVFAFLVVHFLSGPGSENMGYVQWALRFVIFTWGLLAASAAVFRKPEQMPTLILLYLCSWAWWSVHGLPDGRVMWHSVYGNEDGYGPVAVMGIGFAGIVAVGRSRPRYRWIAGIAAMLCVVGVVASFARGAVLSAALVFVVMWLRSSHKLRSIAFGGVIAVFLLGATKVLFPNGEFWAEMATIKDGTEDETGSDRMYLWSAALQLYAAHPVLGVGPANFGATGAAFFEDGELGGPYIEAGRIYNRVPHNVYVQILAELGTVGAAVYLWMIIDFIVKNWKLRKKSYQRIWEARAGPDWDLRSVLIGMECAMVGFLGCAFFYDQLYYSTFFNLIGLNMLLYHSLDRARRAELQALREASAS
jgi:O-antigen ligase